MDPQRRQADELMTAAARGDRQAFGQLAELTGPAVYRFCLAQLGCPHSAQDARQECLLRAYRGRRDFRAGAHAINWLLGIAMNVVRERRRVRPTVPLDAVDPLAAAPPAQAEELAQLEQAIASLPDRQREVVACRFLRSLSIAQTAEVMGCAQGTVKASLFKALENLRGRMR